MAGSMSRCCTYWGGWVEDHDKLQAVDLLPCHVGGPGGGGDYRDPGGEHVGCSTVLILLSCVCFKYLGGRGCLVQQLGAFLQP